MLWGIFDPRSGRRYYIASVIGMGFATILFAFIVLYGIPSTIDELRATPPVIRLTSGIFITPLLIPFAFMAFLVSLTRLLNIGPAYRWLEARMSKFVVWTVAPGLIAIALHPIVVRIAMPMHGYSICHRLDGSLSMWHNDWVRNPDWCVWGKTHDWVYEQAGLEPPPRRYPRTSPAESGAQRP